MLLKLLGLPNNSKKININKELDDFFNKPIKSAKVDSDINMSDFTKIRDAVLEGIDQDKFNKELAKLPEDLR